MNLQHVLYTFHCASRPRHVSPVAKCCYSRLLGLVSTGKGIGSAKHANLIPRGSRVFFVRPLQ